MSGDINVELLVTDSQGRQEGYLLQSNSYTNTLPNGTYGLEKGETDLSGKSPPLPDSIQFAVNNPPNGKYTIQVIGRNSGTYHVDIVLVNSNYQNSTRSLDGISSVNKVDTYTLTLPDGTLQKVN